VPIDAPIKANEHRRTHAPTAGKRQGPSTIEAENKKRAQAIAAKDTEAKILAKLN